VDQGKAATVVSEDSKMMLLSLELEPDDSHVAGLD
jgi:hypothetical protein